MKPMPPLLCFLTILLAFPSPLLARSASDDYAVYSAKIVSIFGIHFQDDYIWHALGQFDGAVREDTRDGSLRYFGTDDGIPDGTINTVFTDSKGNTWFGTGKGVSRWDGAAWTHYSYDSPFEALETFDIREDEKGTLWFATGNGVRSFNGTTWGVWRKELPAELTRRIAIGHNGVIWFGTEKGLARYDGAQWTLVGPSEYVCSVLEDSQGRTWVLYENKQVQEWRSGGHLVEIINGTVTDLPVSITFTLNYIGAIGEAADGSIWCGAGREFHVFDGATWRTVPLGGNRDYQTISCVASAPDGSLWFGGYFNERYRIKDGVLSYVPLETGPVWNFMLSAAVDSYGVKWFGADRGLSRFDGAHWKTYYDRDGLAGNRVNALAVSREILWCGTDRGLSRYDGVSWKTFGVAEGLSDSSIACLAASRDGKEVWAGTRKGLSRYDGNSWKTIITEDTLQEQSILSLFLDETTGTLYAGTENGALSFNGNSWTKISGPCDSVKSILVDSSRRIWLGSNRGLLRYDGSSWTLFQKNDGISHLPDDSITSLGEDSEGGIWACTNLGSVRFGRSTWAMYLRLDKVTGIAADTDKKLWFVRDGLNMDGAVIGYTLSPETETEPLKGTWTLLFNNCGATGFAFAGSNVWAALPSGRIARIEPNSRDLKVYTTSNGLAYNNVSSIASADGTTVWAAAYSSMDEKSWIMRWDGSSWSTFKTSGGKRDRIAADAKGGIWTVLNTRMVHHGTVERWDVNTGNTTFILYDIDCKTFSITPMNTALFSGYRLYCAPDSLWNTLSVKTVLTQIDSPYDGIVSSIVGDRDNNIWCAGTDNPFGVARYDGVSWKTWTTADGLPTAAINALAVDKTGAAWAATNSGVARFDGEKWLTLTPNNSGLRSEIVTTVAVAPDGAVWFGGWDWIASFTYDTQPTSVGQSAALPAPIGIGSVSPNPFNASTVIRFSIPATGKTSLAVYDITGRKVNDLFSGTLPTGEHSTLWNGRDSFGRQVSSGVYFARLSVGKNSASRKMLFLK